jgi:hypothetical protein
MEKEIDMARNRGRRAKITGGFVGLPWTLLNSRAYRDLPASAAKALPSFVGKTYEHYGNAKIYEVDFTFSYKEAKIRLGFSTSTFYKVICDLMSLGFIDPVDKGGLQGDGRSCSRFRMSSRWKEYETEAFEEVRWPEFQPKIS